MDLESYFARVGFVSVSSALPPPTLSTLQALTAAHTRAIPFENLDVLLGRVIDLDVDAVFAKLVTARRGGYCFEQNGLLLAVLRALGFVVAPLSARVRWQRPRDSIPPRTHMLLRVEIDGESYLTDVGLGGMSLTGPLRLLADVVQPTPHEPRRLVREGPLWFHQVLLGSTWHDVAELTLEEMPEIDRVLANWFTNAHPQSHFKNRLLVARSHNDGGRSTLLNSDWTRRFCDGRSVTTRVPGPEALLALLSAEFGLSFPAGTRFNCLALEW